MAGAHGIAVQAADPRLREGCMETLLHLLRTGAEEIDVLAVTSRTAPGHGLLIPAVVAVHAITRLVIGERDSTVLALQGLATRPAENDRRVSASVEQNHGLLAPLQACADFADQLPGKKRVFTLLPKFKLHVYD